MTIFYFTATGNSLAVAKQIGGELISIPQVIDSNTLQYKDDVIGVVFPIYWWSMPIMVRKFMKKVRLEADYHFAIGTCGNVAGGALRDIQSLAKKKGYGFDYTNHVLMLDNYLPVFDMNAQIESLPKKKVSEQMAKIVTDIKTRKQVKTKTNPINIAMTAVFKCIFRPAKFAKKYTVSDKCNTCGTCAQVCPAKNITVTDKIVFGTKCEGCLACVHTCLQIELRAKSEKRWRNKDVSINEIITANNRTG